MTWQNFTTDNFAIIPYQELLGNYDCVGGCGGRSAHWYFCSCNAAAQKTAPSPSVLMVKAVPPSTTTDRASGIRIMGARRTRPPMCNHGWVFPAVPPCCCTMPPGSAATSMLIKFQKYLVEGIATDGIKG